MSDLDKAIQDVDAAFRRLLLNDEEKHIIAHYVWRTYRSDKLVREQEELTAVALKAMRNASKVRPGEPSDPRSPGYTPET